MLIQVIFSDKRIGLVTQRTLDRLLEEKTIAAFRRHDAWAIIGRDRVREMCQPHRGSDRREKATEPSEISVRKCSAFSSSSSTTPSP